LKTKLKTVINSSMTWLESKRWIARPLVLAVLVLAAAACSDSDKAAADAPAGSAAVTCAGTSATRKSGTAIRRSCHGKAKPGSQPAPPKIRLNNTV